MVLRRGVVLISGVNPEIYNQINETNYDQGQISTGEQVKLHLLYRMKVQRLIMWVCNVHKHNVLHLYRIQTNHIIVSNHI